jgi:hypothetical protein
VAVSLRGQRRCARPAGEPDRATELAERLGGRVVAGRIGPSGEVGGGELGVAQPHTRLLEQQPPIHLTEAASYRSGSRSSIKRQITRASTSLSTPPEHCGGDHNASLDKKGVDVSTLKYVEVPFPEMFRHSRAARSTPHS